MSTLHHDGKLPIDLKFIICMRMSLGGLIGNLKAIFMSSMLLEGYTPFGDKYINSMGVKTISLDVDDCESGIWSVYGYDMDSDFNEDDGDQDMMDIDAALAPHTSDMELPCPSFTDSPNNVICAGLDGRALWGMSCFHWIPGPAVLITSTSWKALLASLKYNGNLRTTTGACSPKSMYHLAVKANLDGLQELAFKNLCSQLAFKNLHSQSTPSNIIAEVFSKFSGQHTKILDMKDKYLVNNFSDPLVYPQWQKKMVEVERGECPHGTVLK
ncbi:hypothetical protein IW261DRAFT_1562576 [Armillaria novae-zelandiae]|uniref:Uncharacterized protein n=1 Tax=Armillaria novae-zelandiae TaxID=153914 RepID=A0AA39PBR7_9AGAR|nr:hypothetical protein IW261DRAFT_1562576 [Armillaria novae-zelandiae]